MEVRHIAAQTEAVRVPKGVYKRTKEQRRRMSESRKGRVPWNKGVPMSDAQRRRLSEVNTGKAVPEETRRKISESLKGRPGHPMSEEVRQKLGASHLGKPHPHTAEWNANISKALTGRSLSAEHRLATSHGHMGQLAWNKGKPMTEEQRRHISAIQRGRKNDPESNRRTAEGVRRYWASLTPEEKRRRTAKGTRALLTHAPRHTTRIEGIMASALDRRGISYERQYRIGRFHADFYLPEWNLVLECDGDYWHSLPRHKEFDLRRDEFMRSLGYRVCRVWEHAIKQNVDAALAEALRNMT